MVTLPSGYRGPADQGRDRDQVMLDGVAQNLIREIVDLHDDLCAKLDRDIQRAALGQADPASGYVTGSKDHDQMDAIAAAIKQAERDRDRLLKNARQQLRRVKEYYQDRLGVRCTDPAHYHTTDERRVG